MWRAGKFLLRLNAASSFQHQRAIFNASHSLTRSAYNIHQVPRYGLPAASACSRITARFFALVRKKVKRYKTPRSKKKIKPCGARRLIPAASIHKKPPTFVRRDPKDKLTKHEREHEKFKQVLGRLEIKQLAWRDGSSDYGKDAEDGAELRRAATHLNPFETIPTFRKKSDCGPPPISMKKRRGAVTISKITFNERIRGVGAIRGVKDQKKFIKKRTRKPAVAVLSSDKRDTV